MSWTLCRNVSIRRLSTTPKVSSWSPATSDSYLVEHLNGLFPPLKFPPELAQRILTHGSHPSAINGQGHNARFEFIGRRVIESYLLLFLNSSSALKATHDLDAILNRTINTYILGEHVGSSWGLGRALRWTPAVPASQVSLTTHDSRKLLRGVGFYKVQGDTVAAVIGGIYHQFGATVAQRVFHTRILPKLSLQRSSEGLPDVFRADALAICQRMGGPDAQLLPETTVEPVIS
ncbi:ribonuclease-III-like-domain-containing protein [Amanita rubescens]|nr:ribonuclease-III-like-domain-containing protein [Amanita rubescens]KAF8338610.1 ribonuclease-III-like-domain-containing protein [Amanita rubescens]